jgi:hypothetical protein
MLLSNTPLREPRRQRWGVLLFILGLHMAVFWSSGSTSNQQQIKTVQYLSLFNASKIENLPAKTIMPKLSTKRIGEPKATSKEMLDAETDSNSPHTNKNSTFSSAPDSALDLDTLRSQAVQIERSRVKSDTEKMNDSKKLNLSLEATFDREVNKIELPECRRQLLGINMPERMRIIQDHSKKKFCRGTM